MVKQMFVKLGNEVQLIDLVIDETEFESTKYYIDNLPCLYNFLDGWVNYPSFKECVEALKFDYKKDQNQISKLLEIIINNTNPLVISDAINKLFRYVPKPGLERIILETLFGHFSFRVNNIDLEKNRSLMNAIAFKNYGENSSEYNAMFDEMIDNERKCSEKRMT